MKYRASEYINETFEDATFYGTVTGLMSSELYYLYFVGEKLDIEQVKRQTFRDSFILTSILRLY